MKLRREILLRLITLEQQVARTHQTGILRHGWLCSELPADYEGPRHYVAVKCTPIPGGGEWCEYEERAGRAPNAGQAT
jgi:hypothetical protein